MWDALSSFTNIKKTTDYDPQTHTNKEQYLRDLLNQERKSKQELLVSFEKEKKEMLESTKSIVFTMKNSLKTSEDEIFRLQNEISKLTSSQRNYHFP